MNTVSDKKLGRVAYESRVGYPYLYHRPWSDLDSRERALWIRAANAVRHALEQPVPMEQNAYDAFPAVTPERENL
jgi:hypothetical protein